jgi:hypothetical protein
VKVTKSQLKQIIKEELGVVMGTHGGGCGEPAEEPESEIEGLASAAMAAIHQLAVAAGADMSTDVETGEEVEAALAEEEKWAQKAAADIEKKGTEGEFTKYCGGDVTQACVDKAAGGSSTKRKKQAAFAANVNSHDDLKYPKSKKK